MGILDRMSRAVKSNLNDLIDRMQDPGKEIDLLVTEMEQQLREGQKEVIAAVAADKRLAATEKDLAAELERWERRAAMAVQAGDDALAREALQKKQEADARLTAVRRDREQQQRYAADLRAQAERLDAKLREIKGRQNTIKAQARARKASGGTATSPSSSPAFASFERMAQQIDDFEAQAEAEVELAMSGKDKDREVAAKFRDLEKQHGGAGVEDELAELKRKLQK